MNFLLRLKIHYLQIFPKYKNNPLATKYWHAVYTYLTTTTYVAIFNACLVSFLVCGCRFFLKITTITMHDMKLIKTTAITAPIIIGNGLELELVAAEPPKLSGGGISEN